MEKKVFIHKSYAVEVVSGILSDIWLQTCGIVFTIPFLFRWISMGLSIQFVRDFLLHLPRRCGCVDQYILYGKNALLTIYNES